MEGPMQINSPTWFHPSCLSAQPERQALVGRILAAALIAADPADAVRRSLSLKQGVLTFREHDWVMADFAHVHIVSIGKAGWTMASAAAQLLREYVSGGMVITKEGHLPSGAALAGMKLVEAGHPLPDARGVSAARGILKQMAAGSEDDLWLVLLSGGGSALMTLPAGNLTLDDLQFTTNLLLRCGADIGQLNTVRKHLEVLKGGGLARACRGRIIALALSDVMGYATEEGTLEVVASGPVSPDSSSFHEAWQVIEQFNLVDQLPPGVVERLRAGLEGKVAETPKPGDAIFGRVQAGVIGSNAASVEAALTQAAAEGLRTRRLPASLSGEARLVGQMLAEIARHGNERPVCLATGGETTVTVRGEGLGGRNLETALGAVESMAGLSDTLLVTLATDGGDGPTDACGAVVDGSTLARAAGLGLDGRACLANNDSYPFFNQLGDLIKSGPTGTNVNDLAFVFHF
jgi:glycerate 2-kinase